MAVPIDMSVVCPVLIGRAAPHAPIVDLPRAFCAAQSPAAIAFSLGTNGGDLVRLAPELAPWPARNRFARWRRPRASPVSAAPPSPLPTASLRPDRSRQNGEDHEYTDNRDRGFGDSSYSAGG